VGITQIECLICSNLRNSLPAYLPIRLRSLDLQASYGETSPEAALLTWAAKAGLPSYLIQPDKIT
jgi:hypothetical protein